MAARPKRSTKPVEHAGMLDTSIAEFTSTLKLPSQHKGTTQRSATPPPTGLASLLPTHSQQRNMDALITAYSSPSPPIPKANEEQVAAAAAAATAASPSTLQSPPRTIPKVEVRLSKAQAAARKRKTIAVSSEDEQGDEDEGEEYEPPGEDEQDRPAAAAASTRSGKKKGGKAAAAAEPKRSPNWSHDSDLQLIAAVLASVKSNGGALPSTQRMGKGAAASPAWTKIAKKVAAMKGVKEAGKVCGARWVALKAKVKVSNTRRHTR